MDNKGSKCDHRPLGVQALAGLTLAASLRVNPTNTGWKPLQDSALSSHRCKIEERSANWRPELLEVLDIINHDIVMEATAVPYDTARERVDKAMVQPPEVRQLRVKLRKPETQGSARQPRTP